MDTLLQVMERRARPAAAAQPVGPARPGDDLPEVPGEGARRSGTPRRRRWPRTCDGFLDGEPIVARPVGPAERAAKWARRRPAIAALTAAVVLSVLGGLLGTSLALARRSPGASAALKAKAAEREQAGIARLREQEARRPGRVGEPEALRCPHEPGPGLLGGPQRPARRHGPRWATPRPSGGDRPSRVRVALLAAHAGVGPYDAPRCIPGGCFKSRVWRSAPTARGSPPPATTRQ